MTRDPHNKMIINTQGYRRSCISCGWSLWWNTVPTKEEEAVISFYHDKERPQCAQERIEAESDE